MSAIAAEIVPPSIPPRTETPHTLLPGMPMQPGQKLPACVRVIGLRDRSKAARTGWLASWLNLDQSADYDAQDALLLSQVRAPFDALLLHGEDQARMSRIVRDWRTALRRKAILVAMSAPGPADRAELYRAGADAVLDVESPPLLALAQSNAVLERLRHLDPFNLAAIKTRVKLSASEQIILGTVLTGRGEPVSKGVVLQKLGKRKTAAADASLRVLINRLNGRLLNAAVKTQRGVGLFIQQVEPQLTEPPTS